MIVNGMKPMEMSPATYTKTLRIPDGQPMILTPELLTQLQRWRWDYTGVSSCCIFSFLYNPMLKMALFLCVPVVTFGKMNKRSYCLIHVKEEVTIDMNRKERLSVSVFPQDTKG